MRKRIVKFISIVMCMCICVCFTPVFAFADEGAGGCESTGVSESAPQKTDTPSTASAPASQPSGNQSSSGQASADQSSVSQPSGQTDSENIDENTSSQGGVNSPNDADGAVENGENAGGSDADGQLDDVDSNTPNTEAVTEATTGSAAVEPGTASIGEPLDYEETPLPAVSYLVAVLFGGIKNASLINKNYSITFDTQVFEYLANENTLINYADTLTLRKSDAEVSYGANHDSILSWMFSGNGEKDGNEYCVFLDFDSYTQHNYKIPGYKLTGNAGNGIYFELFPDDSEYYSYEDIPIDDSSWLLGIGAVANNYKCTSAGTCNVDTSAQTGDNMNFSLLAILGLLALACGTAAVLTARRQER